MDTKAEVLGSNGFFNYMAEETEETPETPEVAQDVETPDVPEVVETPETPDADTSIEVPEEAEEAKDEAKEEVEETPIFDAEADIPTTVAKAREILDKYELPKEVQAAFDALEAKTTTIEHPELIAALTDYGDVETVKAALERDNKVFTVREIEGGQLRPNTDEYMQGLAQSDPSLASWMYFDAASLPSTKYQGITQFEEGICDALGVEGDTVGTVLNRYQRAMNFAKNGVPASEVPSFIPSQYHEAFLTRDRVTREEIMAMEVTDPDIDVYTDDDRLRKIQDLADIQKGIDGDKIIQRTQLADKQAKDLAFNNQIVATQTKLFNGMREQFTDNLLKEVTFSSDTKLNNLQARQNVAMLTQAFMPDSDGEYARNALEASGIKFDFNKAQSLIKAVENRSVALTIAQNQIDENGQQLNPVSLKKATREFEQTTREFLDFAADIINQEKAITSTGTSEELKKAVTKEVEKIKLQPKARPVPKSTPSTQTKKKEELPTYGTPAWDNYWADKELERRAKQARMYQ